ncbi:hypothetical protein EVC08_038 [Rhizobium phage RHph_N65]|nr:hypothetical protein EVC08_038 [Rhizobium phage RHph_N65]
MAKREFKIWFRPYSSSEPIEYDGELYARSVAKSLAERLRLKPEYASMKVYVRKAPATATEEKADG